MVKEELFSWTLEESAKPPVVSLAGTERQVTRFEVFKIIPEGLDDGDSWSAAPRLSKAPCLAAVFHSEEGVFTTNPDSFSETEFLKSAFGFSLYSISPSS